MGGRGGLAWFTICSHFFPTPVELILRPWKTLLTNPCCKRRTLKHQPVPCIQSAKMEIWMKCSHSQRKEAAPADHWSLQRIWVVRRTVPGPGQRKGSVGGRVSVLRGCAVKWQKMDRRWITMLRRLGKWHVVFGGLRLLSDEQGSCWMRQHRVLALIHRHAKQRPHKRLEYKAAQAGEGTQTLVSHLLGEQHTQLLPASRLSSS